MRKSLPTLIVATVLAVLSFWKLFEVDLFHQIRAGQEILGGFNSFELDHWTYTVKGQPWYPNGWLSYALFAFIFKFTGYGGLTFLRSLLVFIWACLLAKLVKDDNDDKVLAALKIFILVPTIYLMCLWRVHVRPDTLAIVLFSSLSFVWLSKRPEPFKLRTSLFILLVWSNIHSGTFLFGFIFFIPIVFLLQSLSLQKKVLWSLAALTMWFINPVGLDAINGFLINIFEYSGLKNINEDEAPLSFKMLSLNYGAGWSYIVWVAYTVMALSSAFVLYFRDRFKDLPGPYKNPYFTFGLAVLFTLISFTRIRGVLYQTTFLLPILAGTFSYYFNHLRKRQIALAIIFILLGIPVILKAEYVLGGRRLGTGIAENFVPVNAVDYIKKIPIEGHLFNNFDFGDILVHRAPEIPIAIDGRDIPYRELRKTWAKPGGFETFLNKNHVTVVLEEITSRSFPYRPRNWSDKEWAPVFLDNSAIVYLKRIPSYSKIIDRDEYRNIFNDSQVSQSAYHDLAIEINRCLRDSTVNVFCLYKKALVLEQMNKPLEALEVIKEAYSWEPWNPRISGELQKLSRYRN